MIVRKMATMFLLGGILFPLASPAEGDADFEPMIRFGIITDLHHANKLDTPTRKYSAALAKAGEFVRTMEKGNAAFIVELGDFVDTLANQKDPEENLGELEKVFTSFRGPSYHVLGNHEFDNLPRNIFLTSVSNTGIPQGKTYYSWDAQGVHFVVLDADYTNMEPHRPFDMKSHEDSFWNWRDAFIPREEVEWLKKDLTASTLPAIVFTHQTMDRVDEQDHNIKNASQIRKIFEDDGQVLAVFSGHDHQGGYANIKGIHYVVLNGNVGVSDVRSWDTTSRSKGFNTRADNQFVMVEVAKKGAECAVVNVKGYGRQPSYTLDCLVKQPGKMYLRCSMYPCFHYEGL